MSAARGRGARRGPHVTQENSGRVCFKPMSAARGLGGPVEAPHVNQKVQAAPCALNGCPPPRVWGARRGPSSKSKRPPNLISPSPPEPQQDQEEVDEVQVEG